jgi:hypothetical protein
MWQMDNLKKHALEALPRLPGSREDWLALLDLSIERQLPEVRTMAIQKITATFPYTLDAFELIAMARKYQVGSWFKTGLQRLAERTNLLTDADAEILGWSTILKLCRLRDRFRPYHQTITVESEFQDELKGMSN